MIAAMSDQDSDSIESRLAGVRARIAEATTQAGRRPEDVTLVAVSKTHGSQAVADALAAGHLVFGENRVQEAQAKYPDLKAGHPRLRLHLIGPLQSNKAADAVRLFDCIETVDRPKLARILAKEMAKTGYRPDCLIQVNTGEESQKAGVSPAAAEELIRLARDELALPVKGLMCIPPVDENPAPHFALLRELARAENLPWLSMGMSGDFETAIRFGATHVRVGTAIFGRRPPLT